MKFAIVALYLLFLIVSGLIAYTSVALALGVR